MTFMFIVCTALAGAFLLPPGDYRTCIGVILALNSIAIAFQLAKERR